MTAWTEEPGRLQSMGFSRQEYWSGLPFPSPGDLPNPGIEPRSPALEVDSLPTELQGKPFKNKNNAPYILRLGEVRDGITTSLNSAGSVKRFDSFPYAFLSWVQ